MASEGRDRFVELMGDYDRAYSAFCAELISVAQFGLIADAIIREVRALDRAAVRDGPPPVEPRSCA